MQTSFPTCLNRIVPMQNCDPSKTHQPVQSGKVIKRNTESTPLNKQKHLREWIIEGLKAGCVLTRCWLLRLQPIMRHDTLITARRGRRLTSLFWHLQFIMEAALIRKLPDELFSLAVGHGGWWVLLWGMCEGQRARRASSHAVFQYNDLATGIHNYVWLHTHRHRLHLFV